MDIRFISEDLLGLKACGLGLGMYVRLCGWKFGLHDERLLLIFLSILVGITVLYTCFQNSLSLDTRRLTTHSRGSKGVPYEYVD